MYHYVTVQMVMRDCESKEDAQIKCERLLPYNPDENSTYMESWEVTRVVEARPYNTVQGIDNI